MMRDSSTSYFLIQIANYFPLMKSRLEEGKVPFGKSIGRPLRTHIGLDLHETRYLSMKDVFHLLLAAA
jgi:hypothetical protein